jgi:hypothetical protein
VDQMPVTRYDSVVYLLSRVGLLALSVGLEEEAECIFRYERRVLSDPGALEVARAIVMLQAGKALEAMRILRETVLAVESTHGAANAIYGVALKEAGLPGVRECFEIVLATSLDANLRTVALAELAAV